MAQAVLPPAKRSGALDLLRFLAVLFVFFGHYTDTFNYVYKIVPANLKYTPVTRYASTALIIFFMVSGYVVTMTSVKRDLKDFAITRLSRIYPLFWVSCIVAFIIPRIVQHSFLGNYSFKTFLINLTMIPSLFGYPLINPVFHTLTIEIIFYFFIAIIILFKLWNRIIAVLTVMLALCIANSIFGNEPAHIVALPFLAGMTFYFIKAGKNNRWKLYILLGINFICALIGAIPLSKLLDDFYKVPGSHSPWTIMFIITGIYSLFLLITLKKINIKSSTFSQMLGEIAYPFYLFHIYFLCFYWHFRNTIQADLLLLLILLATILVSWMINKWIEKPISTIASRLMSSQYLLNK